MTRRLKLVYIAASVLLIAAASIAVYTLFGSLQADADTSNKVTGSEDVSVIFTHDMHSHLDQFPKLGTAMDNVLETYPDSFVLDGGDFSMGTPYQTIFSSQASELKMMKYMGYDVTTFGNHEFDYRPLGLASMLDAATGYGPELVCANIDWDATLADEDLAENAAVLKEACDKYGVKDYTVLEKGGVKMAVFGLLGENAVDYAPESGLIFKDYKEAAEDVVAEIEANEDVDMIVCVSHCGTIENESDTLEKSEDYMLAQTVPDVDLIVSGHSHSTLEEPVQVGNTYLVSCGSYNANMGQVVLTRTNSGSSEDPVYKVKSYELTPLNSLVKNDGDVDDELDKYRALVNSEYFADYGYKASDVLATNDINFTEIASVGLTQGEDTLGDLIADSYKYLVTDADVTVVPVGVIRASIAKGDVTVEDAFNVMSLGYGKDGSSGYPLVKAYLTGRELKAVAEVDASISNFMGVARLYCSGLEYGWNPNRLILNRAVDVTVNGEAVDDDKLYSVVADLYSCQMLGSVKAKSLGLLSIEPKDADGTPITDFEDEIVYNDDGQEVKAWYALAAYIDSFEGDVIPEYYATTHDRKVEIDSKSPAELFKQPNKIAFVAVAAVVVIAAIVVGIVVLVRKRRFKRQEFLEEEIEEVEEEL